MLRLKNGHQLVNERIRKNGKWTVNPDQLAHLDAV